MRWRRLSLLLVAAGAACRAREGTPAAAAPPAARIVAVALVDSAGANAGAGSGALRRVEVQVGPRRDTVPGVVTEMTPGVLADTGLVGFTYEGDSVTGVFVYSVARRSVARHPLLPGLADFASPYTTPSFAPDGQSFLYVSYDSAADSVRPTLRRWPSLDVVASGPGVPVEASDVAPYTTEWHGRDTAVATFSFSDCPAPLSLRTAFVLSAEAMRSDTVLAVNEPPGTPHWWPWRDSVALPIPGVRAWLVASTDGPGLGPGFVIAVRGSGFAPYADSIHDVDFQLPGTTCPGVPLSGPQDAYDAFLRSTSDTAWSPEFQITPPNQRDDYGSPPRVVRYKWSDGDRVVGKAIAWNQRTRRFDVLAPAPEDTTATP